MTRSRPEVEPTVTYEGCVWAQKILDGNLVQTVTELTSQRGGKLFSGKSLAVVQSADDCPYKTLLIAPKDWTEKKLIDSASQGTTLSTCPEGTHGNYVASTKPRTLVGFCGDSEWNAGYVQHLVFGDPCKVLRYPIDRPSKD